MSDSEEDPSEIRFGGFSSPGPPPTGDEVDWESVRAAQPLWVRAYEEAFEQITSTDEGRAEYGDVGGGATIFQAWNTAGLVTGRDPVCVLASGRPPAKTAGIPPSLNVSMAPSQLTDAMAACLLAGNTLRAFTYDGKLGHCVGVFDFDRDRDRFRYHDTWPGRSLLCKENNAAGVDARRDPDGLWTITREEFARVVYAVFLSQQSWAKLNGITYGLRFEDLAGSDFWGFFNLSEIERKEDEEKGKKITVIDLQTGGFREYIRLRFMIEEPSLILRGVLTLDRKWVLGPPFGINPFALDITSSFIRALTPGPDTGLEEAAKTLDALKNPETAQLLIKERESVVIANDSRRKLQLVYLGFCEESLWPSNFSWLKSRNIFDENSAFLRLEIDLTRP